MRRASGLTLEAPADMMDLIIGCWLLNGSAGLVTSLQLSYPQERKHNSQLELLATTRVTPERLDQLLGSLVTLRLHGVCFDWNLCNFGCLITLELAFLSYGTAPILGQLIHILSANPMLRALYLVRVCTDSEKSAARPEVEVLPISLPFLEILEFSSIDGKLRPLISLLQPGTRPLELRLNLLSSHRASEQEAIVSFLSRSNVKTLYLGTFNYFSERWFPYLPQLETLYVVGQWDMEKIWAAISPIPAHDMAQGSLTCPKLHTIKYYRCCWSRTDDLQRLLQSHSIQSFGICEELARRIKFGGNRSFTE
ncbi:hypothetical protein BDV93DRAFT_566499 [Ceratobasidium sp. AG-I]|nr:hypothetical protein BDV93DRAFT_566499 [Ceratobasidium sp. AG-I]